MPGCVVLFEIWMLYLVVVGTGEKVQLQRLIDRSADIVAGSTEQDVRRLVGNPIRRYDARGGMARFLLGERPAEWAYGTTINLRVVVLPGLPILNPLPINLRLFGRGQEDLAVHWTPQKKVLAVIRPELNLPEHVVRFYEPICVAVEIAHHFRSRNGDGAPAD